MKLNTSPLVAIKDPDLQRELREHAQQVNGLSEGRIAANYNAATAVPTSGTYQQGDFVKNSAPTGATPTIGWVCTVGGTPGTFVAVTAGGGGGGAGPPGADGADGADATLSAATLTVASPVIYSETVVSVPGTTSSSKVIAALALRTDAENDIEHAADIGLSLFAQPETDQVRFVLTAASRFTGPIPITYTITP